MVLLRDKTLVMNPQKTYDDAARGFMRLSEYQTQDEEEALKLATAMSLKVHYFIDAVWPLTNIILTL